MLKSFLFAVVFCLVGVAHAETHRVDFKAVLYYSPDGVEKLRMGSARGTLATVYLQPQGSRDFISIEGKSLEVQGLTGLMGDNRELTTFSATLPSDTVAELMKSANGAWYRGSKLESRVARLIEQLQADGSLGAYVWARYITYCCGMSSLDDTVDRLTFRASSGGETLELVIDFANRITVR